ncbi:MAG: hypothetical protein CFE23_13435 [Flavobacterium sp. BFFFF1]|uniref:YfhO family protein n=1 Tax=Flavobacterium sp. BFFFF1 TaxID=2015557 RepID=UPI000BD411B0|nr:YfhO family protein [Flavobacterium sp. BFFFF1]OYU79583.1 MAG: hypothetical protein CFE23_13435 [Flavobacterium sp. BFFFF1]
MKFLNRFFPHLLAVLGFVIISLIYFYPVLQKKALFQSDIAQYTGMAKEQNDFRAKENAEPYWTNSAFAGMPTYQLGANYPHNYIKKLDSVLRFLPRPADYLFLYFMGFYVLLLVMKTDPLKAFFGALAFGFSTYFIIILGVGHNAKAHAIAYMPLVVAGTILVFQRRIILGGLLTMLAVALEINANHFQMTYYLLILLLAITVYYVIKFVKAKQYKLLLISFAALAGAVVLAVGANATGLLATAEYTSFSMRSKSELTVKPDGQKHETTSMPRDYITQYSYGIAESFNLIAPGLFGGSNSEKLGPDSKVVEYLQTQEIEKDRYLSKDEAVAYAADGMPTYWGDQPGVAAPAYVGAIVFFLCVLGLYNDKRKIKYAFLAGAIASLILSWGKNFSLVTDFFIDYVPMYDKFRAVSSIQVVLELCVPVLAVMGLKSFFESDKDRQWKSLKNSAIVTLGILLLLIVSKSVFKFTSINDEGIDPAFVDALIEDRKALYSSDLWRSILLVLAAALVLWMVMKERVSTMIGVVIVGVLMVGDLFLVDKKYVNSEKFVDKYKVDVPFEPSQADQEILKDTGNYRVYDIQGRMQAKASYFHKSIGGYSAVRPRRLDEVIDYQIDTKLKNLAEIIDPETLSLKSNIPALDILNVKYLVVPTRDGELPVTNPFAGGAGWFVSSVKTVASADDEMKNLSGDLRNTAIVNSKDFPQFKNKPFAKDSTASVTLEVSKSNYLKYKTQNAGVGLAVFSEIYYPKGWNAYIDNKKTDHIRADYVLRALEIPAGTHTVEFKFEPQVVKTGSMISLGSSLVMLLLLVGGIYYEGKRKTVIKNPAVK